MKCTPILRGLLPFVALLVGCGEGDEDTDLADGCDITQADCQHAIFDASAEVRGQRGARMPEVRSISLEEFAASLANDAAPSEEPDVWTEVLPLLRLLPNESTLAEESAAAALNGVAAYYDTETKQVTVIERGASDPLDDLFILSHEFVHALQDADLDLTSFVEVRSVSVDSNLAVHALIEGEATVLGLAVVALAVDRDPSELNWAEFGASMRSGVFDEIEASSAPFVTAIQSLPYPLGAEQLAPLWLDEGQRAIDALYVAPPLSVLDWAEDTRVTEASRVEPLDCEPTAGPPGFVGHDREAFGPAGLLAVAVDRGTPVRMAWSAALSFRGDRVVLFREEEVPDSYAVAWRIRFESRAVAASVASGLSPALADGAAVRAVDREVVYFGTTRPEVLPLWTDALHCGTEAELPPPLAREDEGASESALRRSRRREVLVR